MDHGFECIAGVLFSNGSRFSFVLVLCSTSKAAPNSEPVFEPKSLDGISNMSARQLVALLWVACALRLAGRFKGRQVGDAGRHRCAGGLRWGDGKTDFAVWRPSGLLSVGVVAEVRFLGRVMAFWGLSEINLTTSG